MKHFFKLLVTGIILCLIITECKNISVSDKEQPKYSKFFKLKIIQIKPQGWLKEFLERQSSGLTGNIEVAGYPFNTCAWACYKIPGSQKDWWPYEQTSYYIDGVYRLGLLLDDDQLVMKAKKHTRYVLDHLDTIDGRMGPLHLHNEWWRWPYASFFRNYMTEYSLTNDKNIIESLHRHYLTFSAYDFCDDMEMANLEEICWLYGITGDEKLIDMAEKAYSLFTSHYFFRDRAGREIQFSSDRIPNTHAVVYLELVKIPAIMYSYTGNEKYLTDAINGIQKMEKHHMLISGLPSSTEHMKGVSELAGHETCNTAELPYTMGYFLRITGDAQYGDKIERAIFNASMGSITKDFKAHQYFSSPNQVIATLNSNHLGYHSSRMAYLPGHDVECCTGNVNRFMPYFIEQMWLRSVNNGLVAALFGPSSVKAKVGKQKIPIEIIEETKYPFSEKIDFIINTGKSVSFPFYIRIPSWCKFPRILLNGQVIKKNIEPGTFFELNETFTNGDIITLEIPMEINISRWPKNGIGIERGPLVFSYPVDTLKTIVQDYEKSTTEFPGFQFKPGSDWNYALLISDREENQIKVLHNETSGYPWLIENSPIKLIVPAKKVKNWNLRSSIDKETGKVIYRNPPFPEKLITEDETTYIELVPYGCTLLRLTVFPGIRHAEEL